MIQLYEYYIIITNITNCGKFYLNKTIFIFCIVHIYLAFTIIIFGRHHIIIATD